MHCNGGNRPKMDSGKGWQSIVAAPLFTENRSKMDSGRAENQLSPLRYSLKIVQKMTLEGLEINCVPVRPAKRCSRFLGVTGSGCSSLATGIVHASQTRAILSFLPLGDSEVSIQNARIYLWIPCIQNARSRRHKCDHFFFRMDKLMIFGFSSSWMDNTFEMSFVRNFEIFDFWVNPDSVLRWRSLRSGVLLRALCTIDFISWKMSVDPNQRNIQYLQ